MVRHDTCFVPCSHSLEIDFDWSFRVIRVTQEYCLNTTLLEKINREFCPRIVAHSTIEIHQTTAYLYALYMFEYTRKYNILGTIKIAVVIESDIFAVHLEHCHQERKRIWMNSNYYILRGGRCKRKRSRRISLSDVRRARKHDNGNKSCVARYIQWYYYRNGIFP